MSTQYEVECSRCGRVWDGNAQCMCTLEMPWLSDEEESFDDLTSKSSTNCKCQEILRLIEDIMNDKRVIKEQDYLQICNLLKEVYEGA